MTQKIPTKSKPTLFILSTEDFVFRPVGFPFKFNGYLIPNELILNEKGRPFYLLPGINKSNKNSGFLLLSEMVYSRVAYVIKQHKEYSNRDFIFCHVPFLEGSFKVFLNPIEDILQEEIEEAKAICESPEQFVEETFNKGEEQKDLYVCSLTKDMLKNFKKEPALG
jgi:hypothetical protein